MISLIIPCHNGGEQALRAVEAIGEAERPADCTLEAIVVDDASTDGSAELLRAALPPWAQVAETPNNVGRGAAINLGATIARGDQLLLLDCDCLPEASNFLIKHLEVLSALADASIGDVHGVTSGFWGRYQSAAAMRRARSGRYGDLPVETLTTANIMLHATVFNAVGGFDTAYRQYGFEDRDLLLRLRKNGAQLRHNSSAAVVHAASMDLPTICRKMLECGSYTAPLFRTKHPAAYRKLGYAAIDAQLHPILRIIGHILGSPVIALADKIDRHLQSAFWPYRLRAAVARAVTAIAYLEGTRRSRHL